MAGLITTKTDMQKTLQDTQRDIFGNRTWSKFYSDIGLSQMKAESQLTKQFGQEVGQAYSAATQQRSQIASSALGEGYKQRLLDDTDLALQQAYDSYLSSLGSAAYDIADTYSSAAAAIDAEQSKEAENYTAYQQAHFDYYDYLVENYSNTLLSDAAFEGYKVPVRATDDAGDFMLDEEGNPVYETDEQGNTVYRLKTRDELMTSEYEEVDGRKEWKGLYDLDPKTGERKLTLRGADFFDMMENYYATRDGAESFEQWLNEENSELLDWSKSYNPYEYTEAGTRAGSFKTMAGLTSTDYTYEFAERLGGLTTGEVDKMFSRFDSTLEMLADTSKFAGKGEKIIESTQTALTELRTLSDQLGLTEEDLGFDWTDLESQFEQYLQLSETNWERTSEFFGRFFSGIGTGAAIGASTGASIGAVAGTGAVPGVGTVVGGALGGVIGVVLGAIGGIVGGIADGIKGVNESRAQTKQATENAKRQFTMAVNSMIAFAARKRRNLQLNDQF